MNSKIGVERGLENSVVASKIAKIIFKNCGMPAVVALL